MKKLEKCFNCGKKDHYARFCPRTEKSKLVIPKVESHSKVKKVKTKGVEDTKIAKVPKTTLETSIKKIIEDKTKVAKVSTQISTKDIPKKTLSEDNKSIKVPKPTSTSSKASQIISKNWNALIKSGQVKLTNPTTDKVKLSITKKKVKKNKEDSNDELKFKPAVAIDCEMVGVGFGGKDSNIARVSLVDENMNVLYDKYVKPIEKVTDYRTAVSGIRPQNLVKALDFKTVQKEVNDIIVNKILVGHAIHNDLKGLFLFPSRTSIRDTSKYKPFRKMFDGRTPSLKKLSQKVVGSAIQTGEHDSVEDARATMAVYKRHRKAWEKSLLTKKKHNVTKQ